MTPYLINSEKIKILDNEVKEQPITQPLEPVQRHWLQNGFHVTTAH